MNEHLKVRRGNLSLWAFPCCSDIVEYILGEKVDEMKRVEQRCEQCNKYSLCNVCIGAIEKKNTTKIYNVDKILNELVIADSEDVKDIDPSCFYVKQLYSEVFRSDSSNPSREGNFYYLLDDCLSCT